MRAKNLTDQDIKEIVELIDGWDGKLSWKLLIDAIEKRRHMRYTRQALHKHARIYSAFTLKKSSLAESPGNNEKKFESVEVKVLTERCERLASENSRLKAEQDRLLEQFLRWAYNAHTRGLDKEFLNRPLPPINRDVTKKSKI